MISAEIFMPSIPTSVIPRMKMSPKSSNTKEILRKNGIWRESCEESIPPYRGLHRERMESVLLAGKKYLSRD